VKGRLRPWHAGMAITVLAVAGVLVSHLATTDREGTDDTARRTVQLVAPAYRPWAQHLPRDNSPGTERALFILQGVLGGLILGLAVVRIRQSADTDA